MKKPFVFMLFACVACAYSCADNVDKKTSQRYQTCIHNNVTYQCLNSQLCCDGVCVDQTERNCGACATRCAEFESCKLINADIAEISQKYSYACLCGGTTECPGSCCNNECKDLQNDRSHCGTCGNACGKNMVCSNGKCVSYCPTPTLACANGDGVECVDINNDPNNCGECDNECPSRSNSNLHINDSYCSNKRCEIICEDDYINDNGHISDGCETPLNKCGNDTLDPGELCDGDKFVNNICEITNGKDSVPLPTLRCKDDCSGLEEGSCSVVDTDGSKCGNGKVDPGENCDYADDSSKTQSCASQFPGASGQVTCTNECKYDFSQCVSCGDNKITGDETCDGVTFKDGVTTCAAYAPSKYVSGDLSCRSCQISTDNCVEKCVEGTIQCGKDKKSIDSCNNGTMQNVPCPSTKAYCRDGETPECVECIRDADCGDLNKICKDNVCEGKSKTYTDDFSWVADNSRKSSYVEPYEETRNGYKISMQARTEYSSITDCTPNNPKSGVVLKGKAGSFILVSPDSGNLKSLNIDYKLHDKEVTLSLYCNPTQNADTSGNYSIDQKLTSETGLCKDEVKTTNFEVNSKDCKSFKIVPTDGTSDQRIAIQKMTWTMN